MPCGHVFIVRFGILQEGFTPTFYKTAQGKNEKIEYF